MLLFTYTTLLLEMVHMLLMTLVGYVMVAQQSHLMTLYLAVIV